MSDFEKFKQNYTGIIKPEIAYAEAQAKADVRNGMFRDATCSPEANRQLEREHIRNARINAGAKY